MGGGTSKNEGVCTTLSIKISFLLIFNFFKFFVLFFYFFFFLFSFLLFLRKSSHLQNQVKHLGVFPKKKIRKNHNHAKILKRIKKSWETSRRKKEGS